MKAIFRKQAIDIVRNPAVLIQFFIYPAVALVMTELVAKPDQGIDDNMFITMMAAIFAGMALINTMSAVIAEDIEHKSLRLLIMAGVKPHEYLLGAGGFNLLAGTVVAFVFGFSGSFSGIEMFKFLLVMIASVFASILLGAAIGILAKNQQAATAIGTPIAMILGFTPMLASFNQTVEKVAGIFYTQQLNVIVNDFSANFSKALTVIGINIAVLIVFFTLVYNKKGLKG